MSQSTLIAALSLANLEAFDPRAPHGERERRFLCPLCGDGKPTDAAHRSLCANLQSGAWKCQRCSATGKLTDFWRERPTSNRLARARQSLHHAFEAPSPAPAATEAPPATDWRHRLRGLCPLRDTPGAKYLSGRGIPYELAHIAGARFSGDFYGRPAVVFPIRDRSSTLVAATGRYIDGRDNPKTRIAGHKRDGVFMAPVQAQSTLIPGRRVFAPFDKDVPAIIVTEAPLDALSIAAAGFPAIALCGTSGPSWLHLACGFRRVLLAFDADEAGDNAAAVWSGALASYGASCERLRPDGGKDWNEVLCSGGAAALSDWLAPRVLLDTTARAQVETYEGDTLFDE